MIKIINNIYKEKCQNCKKCSPDADCHPKRPSGPRKVAVCTRINLH